MASPAIAASTRAGRGGARRGISRSERERKRPQAPGRIRFFWSAYWRALKMSPASPREPPSCHNVSTYSQRFHILLRHSVQRLTVIEVETAEDPAVGMESSQGRLIPVFCLTRRSCSRVNVLTWHVSELDGPGPSVV